MLKLFLPSVEVLNNETETFENIGEIEVEIEHCLHSIAEWEAKEKVPFFSTKLTYKQFISYLKCMCLTKDVPDKAWLTINNDIRKKVLDYMQDKMTATTIKSGIWNGRSGRKRTITSEQFYYWMFQFNIPLEFEYWHINRLMTLIQVCSIESSPPKKMGKKAAMRQQREINEMRKSMSGSKG